MCNLKLEMVSPVPYQYVLLLAIITEIYFDSKTMESKTVRYVTRDVEMP